MKILARFLKSLGIMGGLGSRRRAPHIQPERTCKQGVLGAQGVVGPPLIYTHLVAGEDLGRVGVCLGGRGSGRLDGLGRHS